MTDRIKEARAYVESAIVHCKTRLNAVGDANYPSEFNSENYYKTRLEFWQTILKALSAYEKLQGVDLDTVKEIEERWGNRFLELEEPVPEGMKRGGYVVDIHFLLTQLKSAKLVADIGKDG